jgi:Zn-dependent M28 family amino/carboxypeptidase
MKQMKWAVVGLLLVAASCGTEKDPKTPPVEEPKEQLEQITIPTFDENKAFDLVKKQVEFGPRVPNSAGHQKCGDWLVQELKKVADTVIQQKATVLSFDDNQLKARNIIASFNAENPQRVMLCAHWDTRPFSDQDPNTKNQAIPGANDGGSGVAVLLEMARLFKENPPRIGVDIILFDAEDYGQPDGMGQTEKANSYCLGSQYWAKNLHVPGYRPRYGILLDMIGGPNAIYTKEGGSVQNASSIVDKVWNTAGRLGYYSRFSNEITPPIVDDHYYINGLAGIPTIDIIEHDKSTPSNFYKYWHTLNDTPENMDKSSLKAVGQTLMDVVYREK